VDAVLTAAHLHNLMPVAGKNKTPYELFHGSAPDVSYLRKWGCLAYVKHPKHQTSKLGAQSEPGMFVGYCPHTKGYRVRLRDRVVVTPHVHFVEEESGAAILSLSVEPVPKGVGVRPVHGESVRDVMMYRDEVMESESSDLEEDHHSPLILKPRPSLSNTCGRSSRLDSHPNSPRTDSGRHASGPNAHDGQTATGSQGWRSCNFQRFRHQDTCTSHSTTAERSCCTLCK
jgi:hypothetical protein